MLYSKDDPLLVLTNYSLMFLPQYPQDVAIVKKNPVYGIIGNTFSFFE